VEEQQQACHRRQRRYSYTTLKEYLERNKEKHENRVFYATDEVSQATYIELFKGQGLEVLYMDSFIDTHFIPSLERDYSDVKFSRVDADLDDTLLDKEKESEIVDPSTNKTRDDEVKEMFEKAINKPRVNVKPQALKGENADTVPPAMVLVPEDARRMQETMALIQQQAMRVPRRPCAAGEHGPPADPKPAGPEPEHHRRCRRRKLSGRGAGGDDLQPDLRHGADGPEGLRCRRHEGVCGSLE
jgi:hypothetical protein